MKFIADLHLHSKYSRATSSQMNLEHLGLQAVIKGIKVLGTGDFTHPFWFKELKEKLEPAEPGLFRLKKSQNRREIYPLPLVAKDGRETDARECRFLLSTEVSCVYSKGGRVRKIHLIVLASSFEIVEKINTQLGWLGNLKADGRPTLGLDAKELVKIVLNISEDCLIVPAHLMTPWFGLFGSRSGFDSLEECFEEYSKYIYAGETGLSASPDMLWRIPDARGIALISNSDSHSPAKLGREANVFDTELSYSAIVKAIRTKNPKDFLYTIEFFPQEGKYHYDGHRLCGIRLSPVESKKYNNICPNCGKPLTIGVLNRVEQLADKPEGFQPEGATPFKSLVPLEEIIAEALGQATGTKQVEQEYRNMIEKLGSELTILLDTPLSEIKTVAKPEIAEGIRRVREGEISVEPGYDGVYGKIRIFSEAETKKSAGQETLF